MRETHSDSGTVVSQAWHTSTVTLRRPDLLAAGKPTTILRTRDSLPHRSHDHTIFVLVATVILQVGHRRQAVHRPAAEQFVPRATIRTREGLTQHQMVEAWERDSGVRVARSTIAMAMARFGVDGARQWTRNTDLIPWKVQAVHKMNYDLRMLRFEGRRRRGEPLSEGDLQKLTSWMDDLKAACNGGGAVIHYVPTSQQGTHWVPREAEDDDLIRRPKGRPSSAHQAAAEEPS